MEEGGDEGVGGDDAFGLEGADLDVEAFDLAVQLREVSRWVVGVRLTW